MGGLNRWRRIFVAAAAGGLVAAPWAHANSNSYGIRYIAGPGTYGSRVAIRTPSVFYTQGNQEILLHRASVQSSASSASALIQAGIVRSSNNAGLDNCGSTGGGYVQFAEYLRLGGSQFVCRYYATTTAGNTHPYDVGRQTTVQRWRVRISGLDKFDVDLNFNTGVPVIGGEIGSVDSSFSTHTSALYGEAGQEQWSYYTSPGPSGSHIVGPGDAIGLLETEPGWSVGYPPTPLYVKHLE